MTGPLARIIVRYLAGALVAYGLITPDVADSGATDPDSALAVGAALGVLVEGVYAVAKARGWAT